MKNLNNAQQQRRVVLVGLSLLVLLTLATFIGQALAANTSAAYGENSYEAANSPAAESGQTVKYTVSITNTGEAATEVFLVDTLPAGAMYQADSLMVAAGNDYSTAVLIQNNGTITWTGTLSPAGYVDLAFNVILSNDVTTELEGGANTAVVTGTGSELVHTVKTTTIASGGLAFLFMPVIWKPFPVAELQISEPVNQTDWTVFWTNLGPNTTYELQEATQPDFSDKISYSMGANVTSKPINHALPNIYYYRVRGIVDGQLGPWSPVRSVLAGKLTASLSPVYKFNEWVVSWNSGGTGVNLYEVQEAHDRYFISVVTYMVNTTSSDLEQRVTKSLSTNNYYCYRVRPIAGGHLGTWSNTECLAGGYADAFDDDSTNWAIRRQDTDDVSNEAYYLEEGNKEYFVLEINGRWDYGLASPLNRAPSPPYAIEAKVGLNEPDNLNSYGFVFGGDWNGASECPNEDYGGCFDHYYRLVFLYNGNPDHLRLQLKRIDRHEGSNSGRGKTLIDYDDINVGSPATGFKIWRIEVKENGTIKIFVDGRQVGQAEDTRYIFNSPYFGVFAATDEYLGSEPWYDRYEVFSLLNEEE